jgi:hypothetical protein
MNDTINPCRNLRKACRTYMYAFSEEIDTSIVAVFTVLSCERFVVDNV